MQVFYQPDHARVGDVIPYFEKGVFHLFYLKNWNRYLGTDRTEGWHRLETEDCVRYDESATGVRGGTGCVICHESRHHLFYCVFDHAPQRQWVCHAVSDDGMASWQPLGERFGADERYYQASDWRDPYVFWNEAEQCWWMLLCAMDNGPTKRRGCVGLCTSNDLMTWTAQPPLYAPGASMGAYECPDFFCIGDWHYLVFSQFTDGFRTVYRTSRSPRGPWDIPASEAFDGRAFYAAKTGFDGKVRTLFGWSPTRIDNTWHINPGRYDGYDYNTYDWGGTMVGHQLLQRPDGSLGVAPVPAVDAAFTLPNALRWEAIGGTFEQEKLTARQRYGALLSWNQVPDVCRFSFDFRYEAGTERIGVALQVDEELARGYYFYFEPDRQRVQWKSALRMHEQGGWTFPYEVELERPVSLAAGQTHHVTLFVQQSLMVLYIDDVALCARGYDWHDRRIALIVSDGAATFENIKLLTQEDQ